MNYPMFRRCFCSRDWVGMKADDYLSVHQFPLRVPYARAAELTQKRLRVRIRPFAFAGLEVAVPWNMLALEYACPACRRESSASCRMTAS